MLDSLKSGFGAGAKGQKHAEELQSLIATARQEREALGALLTQISGRGSKLAQMDKSLDQVSLKADAATTSIKDLSKKIAGLDERLKVFDGVDTRIETLMAQVADAQKQTDKLTGPDGDLQKHRQAVSHLAGQTLETQNAIDTLRKERSTLEDLRAQMRLANGEVKDSLDGMTALKSELEGVRSTATELGQDCERIRQASQAAREEAVAATESVTAIEEKLGPLAELQELSKSTDERLSALNVLAEHVSHKIKALESQKHAIDHAAVQTNRLNEMVWSMDVQINKLAEGSKQVQRAEDTLMRMEKLADDTEAHLATAMATREDFSREFARLEQESRGLTEYLKQNVERLAVEKKEFDAFDHRLKALQSGIADAEGRMDGLLSRDEAVVALVQRIDGIGRDFQILGGQADALAQKQTTLESLAERLAEVDELGKRTLTQQDALLKSRADLEQVRLEIQDLHQAHVEAARLADTVGRDRAALEAFAAQATALLAKAPELESRMAGVLGQMALVDEGTRSAARLGEHTAELDAQLTRVSARLQFIEKLEARINGLHVVTSDVDRKIADQLARIHELDSLKNALDTVGTQVVDTQQKLDGVTALQHKIVPLVTEVERLSDSITETQQQVASIRQDEAAIGEQKAQLADLVEQSRALAADVAGRVRQVQGVADQLTRAAEVKDQLLGELSLVQSRQRDVMCQTEAADEQLKRAEAMVRHLEQRRTELAFSEQKIATFTARLNDLAQHSDSIDLKIKSIAEREALVQAVKAEVDHVHQISSRSKADLNFVTEHRTDVATLRAQVEDLLDRVTDTDRKIAAIEARRKMVEDVQSRANAITNLLDDINLNLEMVGEQKAMIDHVGEKLARLDFMVQQAQNTLRALQGEREVAERIEQSIKSLRAKSPASGEARIA